MHDQRQGITVRAKPESAAATGHLSLLTQAVSKAMNEGIDLVVCDTSGRLHTNIGLMEELGKCRRSLEKRLPGAPHESLLVLDGTTGQPLPTLPCRHLLVS